MLSTKVDSYLRAVSEASTGEEAIASWRPGPVHPNHLKQFQTGPKRGKGHKGGRLRAKGTTRVSANVVDVATDLAVVTADEVALAATAEDQQLLTPASISKNGNG